MGERIELGGCGKDGYMTPRQLKSSASRPTRIADWICMAVGVAGVCALALATLVAFISILTLTVVFHIAIAFPSVLNTSHATAIGMSLFFDVMWTVVFVDAYKTKRC